MERYRTSIGSPSPLNYSRVSNSMNVKSNLESRIEYENSQLALIKLLKILSVVGLVVFLAIGLKIVLDARTRTDECGRKSSLQQYLARLRYRTFGGVNPDSCEKKVDRTEQEADDGKFETITETTTCKKVEKPEDSEGKSFWSFLNFGSQGCEDYKAHEAALKNQKFSVKDRLDSPPSLGDSVKIDAQETHTEIDKFTEITEATAREIKSKFDSIIGDFAIRYEEKIAAQISAPVEYEDDSKAIQKSKTLLEKPVVFDLQLKINDLVHSVRNLARKKKLVFDFQNHFFNVTKTPNTCANEITELQKKIVLDNEKLSHSKAISVEWENDLKRLQEAIHNTLNESKNKGPLSKIQELKDEIEILMKRKGDALKTQAEIEKKQAQIRAYEAEITTLNALISDLMKALNDIDDQIAILQNDKTKFENDIKMNQSRKILLEMKLEFAVRNKHIKEYLLSLIDTSEGKSNDLYTLFADKIASEKELKNILKGLIIQSRSGQNEVSISEEQIDSIIKQDEKDFEDISRLYNELVRIINEYKDIDFDIKAMQTKIIDIGKGTDAAKTEINRIVQRIRDLENQKTHKNSEIHQKRDKIKDIEDKIRKASDYIQNNRININDIDVQISLKTKENEDLSDQWRVT